MRILVENRDTSVRLDRFLVDKVDAWSLRMVRRIIEQRSVLVNNRPARASLKLQQGMTVSIAEHVLGGEKQSVHEAVHIVVRSPDYAAVCKPSGLHTESLAGSNESSLESMLPALFPDDKATLVNRLDKATSGIVVVAFSVAAAQAFKEREQRGVLQKVYVALAKGRLGADTVIDSALDMANRKVTRVLARPAEDSSRHTLVEPVAYDAESDCTLVWAKIKRGARHQIRVHLASIGHPLVGDSLYGSGDGTFLHLHHYHFEMQDFSARLEPDWPDWQRWKDVIVKHQKSRS